MTWNFNVRIPDGLKADRDSLSKDRKEHNFHSEISALTVINGEIAEIMTIRWYQAKNSNVTRCCVWIKDGFTGGNYAVNAGHSVSGYGLDRFSESFIKLLPKLGIEHDCHISGMRVVEELIKQVIAEIAPSIEYIYLHLANG